MQSAHYQTNCETYDFLPEEQILAACKVNGQEGVDRFSIVTAACATIRSDRKMLQDLGRDVKAVKI